MAQAFYCQGCKATYTAELRGRSCPACGDELTHGRVPSGRSVRARDTDGQGRAVWDQIIKRDLCAFCHRKPVYAPMPHNPKKWSFDNTIDHIQPKALGGSKGSWTNRAGLCRPCNARKAHTPLLFFMLQEQGTDLDHLMVEDQNGKKSWPIPENRTPEQVEAADAADARKILAQLRGHQVGS